MPVSVAIGREPTGRPMPSATVGSAAVLHGQVDPAELAETLCGVEPSFVCREVLERTGLHGAGRAPSTGIFAKPLTIAIILIVAWVVVRLLDRVIDRFVRSIADGPEPTPPLKRSLRRTPIVAHPAGGQPRHGAVSLRAAARAETLGHVLRSIAGRRRLGHRRRSRSWASSASTSARSSPAPGSPAWRSASAPRAS